MKDFRVCKNFEGKQGRSAKTDWYEGISTEICQRIEILRDKIKDIKINRLRKQESRKKD